MNNNRYQDMDILLDTGSIFSVFKNRDMLFNVRNSNRFLKAFTNGGRQDSDKVADLPGFFTVWYNPASMINILSWTNISKRFRITADTSLGKFITVHLSQSRKMTFEEVTSDLYLFRNPGMFTTTNKISGYTYLMLAEARLQDFTKHEIQGAVRAKEIHRALGFPGYKEYLWLLKNNMIKDSKVSLEDAKRALHIYGEDTAVVKGRTTKNKQSKIEYIKLPELPRTILLKHDKINLMVDYMIVQGVQFLTTISAKLNYRTVEALPYVNKKGVKKEDILQGVKKVINLYQSRGLIVQQISGDNEFECIREDISPILLNITAAEEHVSPVERSIRSIKDRTQHIVNIHAVW